MTASEPLPIPAALDGERVDRVVAMLTGWSRSDVQALVQQGAVLVDGREVGKSRRLHAGEVVELLAEPEPDALPGPEPDVAVSVVHEDADVIVVDKPAGLVVHPGAGNATGTLVGGLLARYPELAGVGDAHRPGIVHRLDRDTSGLLMVARSARARTTRSSRNSPRTPPSGATSRSVWGHLTSPRGMIDAPIGRSESRRTRMAVRDAGRPARTEYEVDEAFSEPVTSLLHCRLETGRTHQIRVHLSAIGHPVVGDGTYGGKRDSLALDRPFLHAAELAFDHPGTGEPVAFVSPLPPELTAVLARLQ